MVSPPLPPHSHPSYRNADRLSLREAECSTPQEPETEGEQSVRLVGTRSVRPEWSSRPPFFLPGAWGQGACYRAVGLLFPGASRNGKRRHGDLQSGPPDPSRPPTPGLGALCGVVSAVTMGPQPQVSPGRGWMHSCLRDGTFLAAQRNLRTPCGRGTFLL